MEQFVIEAGGWDLLGQVVAMFDQLDVWFQDPEFRGCLFMNAATEFPSRHDPIHRAAERTGCECDGDDAESAGARADCGCGADGGADHASDDGVIIARHTRGAREAAQVARGTVGGG